MGAALFMISQDKTWLIRVPGADDAHTQLGYGESAEKIPEGKTKGNVYFVLEKETALSWLLLPNSHVQRWESRVTFTLPKKP
jgi:hypothetical protein